MATRRSAGLDQAQVDDLRAALEGGRRRRVAVSGSQFPPGTTGAVVRVGDPAVDGPDFVTVRVKIGSSTDDLGFAPSELTLPGGKASVAAPTARGPATERQAVRATAVRKPAADRAPEPGPSAGSTAEADGARATMPGAAAADVPTPPTGPAPVRDGARRSRPAAGTARRGPLPPKVSITVASSGASWSVSVTRGARSIVKDVAVAPGAVAAIAELIGDPAVSGAVGEINDAALVEAEARAASLRAELAEVEALLAGHHRP